MAYVFDFNAEVALARAEYPDALKGKGDFSATRPGRRDAPVAAGDGFYAGMLSMLNSNCLKSS